MKEAPSSGVEIQALINKIEKNTTNGKNSNSINTQKAEVREKIRILGLNKNFKTWVTAYNNLQKKLQDALAINKASFVKFPHTGRLNWETLHNQISTVKPSKLAYNKQSRVKFMNLNSAAKEMFGSEYSAYFGKKVKSPQTKSEYSNRKNTLLKITSRAPSEVSTEMSTSTGRALRRLGARTASTNGTLPMRVGGRAGERNRVTPPDSPRRESNRPLIIPVIPPPPSPRSNSTLASNLRSLQGVSRRGSVSSVGTSQISTEERRAEKNKKLETKSTYSNSSLPNELTTNNFRNTIQAKVGKEVVKLKTNKKFPVKGLKNYFNKLKSTLKKGVNENKQGVINQIVNKELKNYTSWLVKNRQQAPIQFISGKPAPKLNQKSRYMINAKIKQYKNRLDAAKDPKILLKLESDINKWNPKATNKHYKNNYLAKIKSATILKTKRAMGQNSQEAMAAFRR